MGQVKLQNIRQLGEYFTQCILFSWLCIIFPFLGTNVTINKETNTFSEFSLITLFFLSFDHLQQSDHFSGTFLEKINESLESFNNEIIFFCSSGGRGGERSIGIFSRYIDKAIVFRLLLFPRSLSYCNLQRF